MCRAEVMMSSWSLGLSLTECLSVAPSSLSSTPWIFSTHLLIECGPWEIRSKLVGFFIISCRLVAFISSQRTVFLPILLGCFVFGFAVVLFLLPVLGTWCALSAYSYWSSSLYLGPVLASCARASRELVESREVSFKELAYVIVEAWQIKTCKGPFR